jgi:hypothetical protein
VKAMRRGYISDGIGECAYDIATCANSRFVTSNSGHARYHELDAVSLPNTFPCVSKFANPIRASISSIFLNPQIARWREAEAAL